eukprot:15444189-Alexandrium_andersonii.AAC.1
MAGGLHEKKQQREARRAQAVATSHCSCTTHFRVFGRLRLQVVAVTRGEGRQHLLKCTCPDMASKLAPEPPAG